MPEIREAGASKNISVCLHADPGAGKTSFIGSGGSDYNILIVRPPTDKVDSILGSGCKEVVCRDWEDMMEVEVMLQHEGEQWDWVWFDGISQWQDVGLADVYNAALDRAGPPGDKARKHRAQFGPDKGEFRINMIRNADWCRNVSTMETFNFGVTAHTWWGKAFDEEGKEEEREIMLPWIQGKGMVSRICGMVNVVAYLDVQERTVRGQQREVRILHTNKSDRFYAKCQFKGAFGDTGTMANPTLPKFIEAIEAVRPRQKPARTNRGRARRPVRA